MSVNSFALKIENKAMKKKQTEIKKNEKKGGKKREEKTTDIQNENAFAAHQLSRIVMTALLEKMSVFCLFFDLAILARTRPSKTHCIMTPRIDWSITMTMASGHSSVK